MAATYERDGVWVPVPTPRSLWRVIRDAYLNALAYTNGDAAMAARALGLTPRAFHYQLRQHWIKTGNRAPLKGRRQRPTRRGDQCVPRCVITRAPVHRTTGKRRLILLAKAQP
jgi:hypothetical protein